MGQIKWCRRESCIDPTHGDSSKRIECRLFIDECSNNCRAAVGLSYKEKIADIDRTALTFNAISNLPDIAGGGLGSAEESTALVITA